jgi:hypothetical protein
LRRQSVQFHDFPSFIIIIHNASRQPSAKQHKPKDLSMQAALKLQEVVDVKVETHTTENLLQTSIKRTRQRTSQTKAKAFWTTSECLPNQNASMISFNTHISLSFLSLPAPA